MDRLQNEGPFALAKDVPVNRFDNDLELRFMPLLEQGIQQCFDAKVGCGRGKNW